MPARTFSFAMPSGCIDGAVLWSGTGAGTTCAAGSGTISIPTCGAVQITWWIGSVSSANFQKDCLYIDGVLVNAAQGNNPAGNATGTIPIDVPGGLESGATYPIAVVCRCGAGGGNSSWDAYIVVTCCS